MKKINDIKAEIAEYSERMLEITNVEELNEELRSEFTELEEKRNLARTDLGMAEQAERLAAEEASRSLNVEPQNEDVTMIEAFRNYVNTGVIDSEHAGPNGGFMFRADPLLTTTEAGVIEKQIAPTSIVKSHGLELANALGVNVMVGLNGTVELPNMAQLDASVVAEGAAYVTGGAAPAVIEMKGRTFGNSQGFSKQFLYTASPDLVTKIVADMQAANERKIMADLFDNFGVDALDASIASTATGLTYGDMVSLKAIDYAIGNTAFVTTTALRAYLEQKNASGAGIKFIWDNGVVAGEPAVASAAANTNAAYFGDWSQAVVGIWGTEVIVDPYTLKKAGKVELAVNTYADTAIQNYRAFKWFDDASAAV